VFLYNFVDCGFTYFGIIWLTGLYYFGIIWLIVCVCVVHVSPSLHVICSLRAFLYIRPRAELSHVPRFHLYGKFQGCSMYQFVVTI
jgi:hypothetical protein